MKKRRTLDLASHEVREDLGLSDEEVELPRRPLRLPNLLLLPRLLECLLLSLLALLAFTLLVALDVQHELLSGSVGEEEKKDSSVTDEREERKGKQRTSRITLFALICTSFTPFVLVDALFASRATMEEKRFEKNWREEVLCC